jgi:cytochrome P450
MVNPNATDEAQKRPEDFSYPSEEMAQCPYPFYEAVRSACPVYQLPGEQTFFVSKYDDVLDVARRPDDFSSLRPPVQAGDPEFEAIAAKGFHQPPTLTNNDPPAHTRFRKLINRTFSSKAVEAMEPQITEIVNLLLDDFTAEGKVEFVKQYAMMLPAMVIADVLGVPREEIPTFKKWADDIQVLVTGFFTREQGLECMDSMVAFQHYFAKEVEKRRANPGDDVLTKLVTAEVAGERPLDLEEILELCRVFLVGGNETTASLLTNTVKLLLDHPEQLQMVIKDRSLIDAAIEESLRIESPAQWLGRRVLKDGVSVGGVEIPNGSRVLVSWASANRDDAVFECPDDFDITRTTDQHHVAFGFANHYCIGVHLARAEVKIAIDALLDRVENLRFDPEHSELTYVNSPVLRMPGKMHLLFDPIS